MLLPHLVLVHAHLFALSLTIVVCPHAHTCHGQPRYLHAMGTSRCLSCTFGFRGDTLSPCFHTPAHRGPVAHTHFVWAFRPLPRSRATLLLFLHAAPAASNPALHEGVPCFKVHACELSHTVTGHDVKNHAPPCCAQDLPTRPTSLPPCTPPLDSSTGNAVTPPNWARPQNCCSQCEQRHTHHDSQTRYNARHGTSAVCTHLHPIGCSGNTENRHPPSPHRTPQHVWVC